jgi:hypothetical protein
MLLRYPAVASEHDFRGTPVMIRNGRFELHGLDPAETYPVVLLDTKNNTGAKIEVSAKAHEGQPLQVQMEPCGSVTARFVDPDGKPLAEYDPTLKIVITPGPPTYSQSAIDSLMLRADEDFVQNFHGLQTPHPQTDANGSCTISMLVPGASYRFVISRKGKLTATTIFQVKPGESLTLPDIVTER